MNNIFTTTGIKNIQSGDRIYFIDDNIRMSSVIIDKIDTIHYNTYYKISTHSGNIICGNDFNVYTCNLCNFNDNYGYDKVITTKKPSDLSIGDLLLTPYFGVSKGMSNENILIDILPIVEEIITNHEKYDKYKVSYDDLTISILCPNGKKTSPMLRRVNIKSLLEIMAWYITEGWCSNQWMKNKSASRFSASLSQSLYKNFENNESIIENIKNLGLELSITYSDQKENGIPKETEYRFSSVMSVLMYSCGCSSKEKHIPTWLMNILNCYPDQIYNFLSTMVAGDGHYNYISNMYSYITNSHELAKDIAYLIMKLGFYVKIIEPKKNNGVYTICFGNTGRKQGLVKYNDTALTKITNIEVINEPIDIELPSCSGGIFVGEFGNILIKTP